MLESFHFLAGEQSDGQPAQDRWFGRFLQVPPTRHSAMSAAFARSWGTKSPSPPIDALSASSPRPLAPPSRLAADSSESPEFSQRLSLRRYELPLVRTVKTPVKIPQIVPALVPVTVAVPKVVQPGGPLAAPQAQLTHREILVPSSKVRWVDAYRIDEVTESKLVEAVEGNGQVLELRELGRLPNSRVAQRCGGTFLAPQDPRLLAIPLDTQRQRSECWDEQGNFKSKRLERLEESKIEKIPAPEPPAPSDHWNVRFGVSLVKGGPDGSFIKISSVAANSPAALAGFQSGDSIIQVSGQAATRVDCLFQASHRSRGVLVLQVDRQGRRFFLHAVA